MSHRLHGPGLILAALTLLLVAGCSDHGADLAGPGDGGQDDPVSYAAQIQPIFDVNCLGCHGPGGNAGLDLSPAVSYANLVGENAQASAGIRVVAGDAASSVLYLRLTGDGLGLMPPAGDLGTATTELVQRWIDEGAEEN